MTILQRYSWFYSILVVQIKWAKIEVFTILLTANKAWRCSIGLMNSDQFELIFVRFFDDFSFDFWWMHIRYYFTILIRHKHTQTRIHDQKYTYILKHTRYINTNTHKLSYSNTYVYIKAHTITVIRTKNHVQFNTNTHAQTCFANTHTSIH